jgi:hypothetical protein
MHFFQMALCVMVAYEVKCFIEEKTEMDIHFITFKNLKTVCNKLVSSIF